MQFEQFRKLVVAPAVILAVAIVVGLAVHGSAMGARGQEDVITVTGSAKQRVESDLAKWVANFSRRSGVYDLKEASAQAAADTVAIKKFIVGKGIPETAITVTPVQSEAMYDYQKGGGYVSGYRVWQEVRVESTDIAKVEELAKVASKLIDQGIVPEYQRTEYYYTKLAELRPQLFAEATKDAKQRAEAMASGTGNRVGSLKSAKTGVIQIMAPNSVDVSDWGTYDLSTKEKEISATVNVSFQLK